MSGQDGNLHADDDKPKYIEEVYSMKFKFRITVYSGSLGLKSYNVLFTDIREYTSSRYAWIAAQRIAKKYNHLIHTSTPVGFTVEMM